jgi:hypothetical protein
MKPFLSALPNQAVERRGFLLASGIGVLAIGEGQRDARGRLGP